jgi:hypothetical protein
MGSSVTFSSIIPALKLIKFTLQTSLATFAVTTQISKYSYQAKRGKISERNKQKKKGLLWSLIEILNRKQEEKIQKYC